MKLITSREYKVMLRHDWFAGSESELLDRSNEFWMDFQEIMQELNLKCTGAPHQVKVHRHITFFDTKGHLLNKNAYVFRERTDPKKVEREITLKFRHKDRCVSQERDMSTSLEESKDKI